MSKSRKPESHSFTRKCNYNTALAKLWHVSCAKSSSDDTRLQNRHNPAVCLVTRNMNYSTLPAEQLSILAYAHPPIQPQGLALAVVIVSALLLAVNFVAVGLRVWVRSWYFRSSSAWGIDDTLAAVGFVGLFSFYTNTPILCKRSGFLGRTSLIRRRSCPSSRAASLQFSRRATAWAPGTQTWTRFSRSGPASI